MIEVHRERPIVAVDHIPAEHDAARGVCGVMECVLFPRDRRSREFPHPRHFSRHHRGRGRAGRRVRLGINDARFFQL